jgi:threonine/homoserine/homoserine lactone efflux protein
MQSAGEVIVKGIVLGLAAGATPGPLMALVMAQTLKHGAKEGCKAAIVPFITDLPVIVISLLVTSQLAHFQKALGAVSFAGALFVLYLAWECLHPPEVSTKIREEPKTLAKGIATNLLSPNPWLFWFTAGAATLGNAWETGWYAAVLFLLLFYVFLCGWMAMLSMVTGRSRAFLKGRAYRITLGILGAALVVFAGMLIRDGLRLVGA